MAKIHFASGLLLCGDSCKIEYARCPNHFPIHTKHLLDRAATVDGVLIWPCIGGPSAKVLFLVTWRGNSKKERTKVMEPWVARLDLRGLSTGLLFRTVE